MLFVGREDNEGEEEGRFCLLTSVFASFRSGPGLPRGLNGWFQGN